VIHSEARAELDAAMEFYESRAAGLGLDLQADVKEAAAKIQQNPEAWPPHKRTGFRKYFVNRFPFTVFYMELPDCIWVAAIAHGRRRPDYWRRRQREEER
jgi:toxin ParE1/3/4